MRNKLFSVTLTLISGQRVSFFSYEIYRYGGACLMLRRIAANRTLCSKIPKIERLLRYSHLEAQGVATGSKHLNHTESLKMKESGKHARISGFDLKKVYFMITIKHANGWELKTINITYFILISIRI